MSIADGTRENKYNFTNLSILRKIVPVIIVALIGIAVGRSVSGDVRLREHNVTLSEKNFEQDYYDLKLKRIEYLALKTKLDTDIKELDQKVEEQVARRLEIEKKNLKFSKVINNRPSLEKLRDLKVELDNLLGENRANWVLSDMGSYYNMNDLIDNAVKSGDLENMQKAFKAKIVVKEIFKITFKLRR